MYIGKGFTDKFIEELKYLVFYEDAFWVIVVPTLYY